MEVDELLSVIIFLYSLSLKRTAFYERCHYWLMLYWLHCSNSMKSSILNIFIFSFIRRINAKPWTWCRSRTPQDMDRTLTLIFAKLETTWNITTKISAFLQLEEKWILTKFVECGSKIGPTTPIWSFRHFWQEIQIQGTKCLQI